MLELDEIHLGRIEVSGVGPDAHRGTGGARSAVADAGQRLGDEAGAEGDTVNAAAAPDLDFQPCRQRIGDRNADAVQAAREVVGIAGFLLVELAAGVQLAEDQFDRRPPFLRVDFDRNAAAVVGNLDQAVGADQYADPLGVAGKRLVGGVVDDLLDDVGRAGRPVYIPGRSLTGSRSLRTRMEEAEYSVMRLENGAMEAVDRNNQRLAADCTCCGGIPNAPIIARTARIWKPLRVW